MPLPKRRISKTRRDKRRKNLKDVVTKVKACVKCQEPVKPHTVCQNCETYNK